MLYINSLRTQSKYSVSVGETVLYECGHLMLITTINIQSRVELFGKNAVKISRESASLPRILVLF
jgi:hypothetical protein